MRKSREEFYGVYFFLFASSSSFCSQKRIISVSSRMKIVKVPYLRLSDLTPALVPCLRTAFAECAVSLEIAFFLCNLAGCFVNSSGGERKSTTGGRRSEVCALMSENRSISQGFFYNHHKISTYCRITLLGLLRVAGEDDEFRLVCLEALHVQLLTLLAQIPPAVVDNNADTTRLLPSDTCLLKLGKGESTALTDLRVVADSLCTDGWAEELEGTDTEGSSLGLAGLTATKFASRLVEPGADTALPVLAEVVCVEDVVVLETHVCAKKESESSVKRS